MVKNKNSKPQELPIGIGKQRGKPNLKIHYRPKRKNFCLEDDVMVMDTYQKDFLGQHTETFDPDMTVYSN